MLPGLLAVILTYEGAFHAAHGRDLGPGDVAGGGALSPAICRLLDQRGHLVGIAEPAGASGLLHPSVVLV